MNKEVISKKSHKGRNKVKIQKDSNENKIVITDYEQEDQQTAEDINKKRKEDTDTIYKTRKEMDEQKIEKENKNIKINDGQKSL